MNYSLDALCQVVLTAHGAAIYNTFNSRYLYVEDSRTIVRAGSVLKEPLWEVMHIFGEHLTNGGKVPFEGCEIVITEEGNV